MNTDGPLIPPPLRGASGDAGPPQAGPQQQSKKVTVPDLLRKAREGLPITMMTAYDYPSARLVDDAGIDAVLVGDSLGMVVLGYENTLPVTMEEMLHHAKAVRRGTKRALTIGDMPFLSYQASIEDAVRNAGRFLKEALFDAIKLEGGKDFAPAIRAINASGIPVMGHLGLTPQSIHKFGGWRVQGKTAVDAQRILDDAVDLERAGCFSLVLESIPRQLAALISNRLSIPVIGIGAGLECDGQVLVIHDLLGLYDRFTPKFARRYTDLHAVALNALTCWRKDVEKKRFPTAQHSYEMPEQEWNLLTAGFPANAMARSHPE